MDDLRQKIFKPPGAPASSSSTSAAAAEKGEPQSTGASQYAPLPWTNYFEENVSISVGDTQFSVYASGLSANQGAGGPVFVFHHGAGHSGRTFGLVSKHVYESDPARATAVVAPDMRAHGGTAGANQEDLSLGRLVDDFVALVTTMFPANGSGSAKAPRNLVLVGHSMGGAVDQGVLGLVLIDIVEGSAIDSLPSIPAFIAARPASFGSIESAIRWHVDANHIQNTESARLSVPSLIKPAATADGAPCWTWRTDLLPSQKFWHGWYAGLSSTFVSAPTAKLLILAGTDRLDKDLLIAQMQGKFQLELLPAAGHTIQEDLPAVVGDALISFCKRNQPLDISEIRRRNQAS
ncbi:Protein phosphatase methylesterase 1 [Coemansia sp. Benny D160-2]|nr:Protein phosphatase methylesterase 1 [Coemansia sp. Benny D160-2]